MVGRSTILPVAMVVVIMFLAFIAITTGRSNEPDVVVDDSYPYHICTFIEYCEGDLCTKDSTSFVLYLEYANGEPRLEMPRTSPRVVEEDILGGKSYTTTGGNLSGTMSLYESRRFDWIATSLIDARRIDHFATGRCERLRTP